MEHLIEICYYLYIMIIYSRLFRRMTIMSANVKLLIAVGALMSFSFVANLLSYIIALIVVFFRMVKQMNTNVKLLIAVAALMSFSFIANLI